MSSKTARGASLVIAAGLVMSGCTESAQGPEATGGPTPSASEPASASPSPSVPTKPDRPEAMERDDAEGAAAAAEYFIELYPYVMATGDTEEFEAMSHRACGFCRELSAQASEIASAEEVFVGGGTTVEITKHYKRDPVTGIYPFDSKITQHAQKITAKNGEILLDADRETLTRRVEMGRKDNAWVMVAVAPVPEQDQ